MINWKIKSTREAERNKKYLRSISLKSNKHWVNMRFESIKLYYTILYIGTLQRTMRANKILKNVRHVT